MAITTAPSNNPVRTPANASRAPSGLRIAGHALSLVMSLFALYVGLRTYGTMQLLESVFHLFMGGLGVWLTIASWRGSRAAWSFLLALNGTQAVFGLFGAPAAAVYLDTGMMVMMIPAAGYAIATALLSLLRADYQTK